jgi:hypothetical protein
MPGCSIGVFVDGVSVEVGVTVGVVVVVDGSRGVVEAGLGCVQAASATRHKERRSIALIIPCAGCKWW